MPASITIIRGLPVAVCETITPMTSSCNEIRRLSTFPDLASEEMVESIRFGSEFRP